MPAPAPSPGDGPRAGELLRLLGRLHMLELLQQVLHGGPGPHRFTDLQSRLGISANTLSERLKALVEAGLLSRTPRNEVPPRVDYAATARARELEPLLAALAEWSRRHTAAPAVAAPPALPISL